MAGHGYVAEEDKSHAIKGVMETFEELYPLIVFDAEVRLSMNAYLHACRAIESDDIAFVTGNKDMMTILHEEPFREELYAIAKRFSLSGVVQYKWVDNDGEIRTIPLKW